MFRRPSRASVAIAVLALSMSGAPAGAEGFFDFLLGNTSGSPREQASTPAPADATRRPMHLTVRPRASVAHLGRGVAFCVRLCDGRYFPIQRGTNVEPARICNSLCPASRTKVFAGADISRAVAADGTHYAGLRSAFLYRNETVDNCTCNGVTAYGLAMMDVHEDPTLRAGDLVATPAGLVRSVAMFKAAQKNGDEAMATSALPLGLRGRLSDKEDQPSMLLRLSDLREAPPVPKPTTRSSRVKRFHDMFGQRKRARQAR